VREQRALQMVTTPNIGIDTAIPEDRAMSFAIIPTHAAELERSRALPVSFVDPGYRFATRVTRHEWRTLLATWEQLQPYADSFASAFFDTLFDSAPELRQLFGGSSLEADFLQFAHLLTELVSAQDSPEELDRRIEAVVCRLGGDLVHEHDAAIRGAIAAMMSEVAFSGMTREVRSLWKSAYAHLGTVLTAATRRVALDKVTAQLVTALRAELRLEAWHSPALEHALEDAPHAEAA
jgi:hemoglobin-like flavoprotein